jgi:hypothetical protein
MFSSGEMSGPEAAADAEPPAALKAPVAPIIDLSKIREHPEATKPAAPHLEVLDAVDAMDATDAVLAGGGFLPSAGES